MAKDDEKAALYRMLVQQADPWLLIERMRTLGFWPEGEPIPDEPDEVQAERQDIIDKLERLRNQSSKLKDPEAALKAERVRRWKESKRRRAIAKAARETDSAERRAAWEERRAESVVYAGPGVSGGLEEKESDVGRLQAQGLPVMHSPADVASAMEISVSALRWLTYHRNGTTVVHYHRYSVPKKVAGVRNISAPKPALAQAQRWVFERLLTSVPVAASAHGFVSGRSIVSNAKPHVGKAVVINLDLVDFFPTITFKRVRGLFASLGYSQSVSSILALLCTEPPRVAAELDGKLFHVAVGSRTLPQGACTSPAVTNILCRRLDHRLEKLATRLDYQYTRYADDLTFSAAGGERVGSLLGTVRGIIRDEGFSEHPQKTRIMRRGRAQKVTGLVVNDKVSIPRSVRRELRAILHNAARNGMASENRNGHPRFHQYLQGCVAYLSMVDPSHADQWRAALARAQPSRA